MREDAVGGDDAFGWLCVPAGVFLLLGLVLVLVLVAAAAAAARTRSLKTHRANAIESAVHGVTHGISKRNV